MTDLPPTPNQDSQTEENSQKSLSSWRCLTGAMISGGLAFAAYSLTSSIAQTYAAKPIASSNPTAINIAIAVRTLVVGVSSLATFVFGIATVGLVALAIQISIQNWKNRTASTSD
ncbi:MAG: DUF3082 domain-containing protein [Symploca sp. SIO1B1]|nr:DUF3082 domain-containing protein [Symploca sp. SIO1C2]NER46514.1 DUF3082 domain-containing protein [Symploca sp. SIO1A3]NER96601.1 DUF3082 domain-containing protein [Symploca sp. SIO1B1]